MSSNLLISIELTAHVKTTNHLGPTQDMKSGALRRIDCYRTSFSFLLPFFPAHARLSSNLSDTDFKTVSNSYTSETK